MRLIDYNLEFRNPDIDFNPSGIMIMMYEYPGNKADICSYHQMNIVQRKHKGIPHHFIIAKDGSIVKGLPLTMRGAHTRHLDRTHIGIGVSNEHNRERLEVNGERLMSLGVLCGYLCEAYDIDPEKGILAKIFQSRYYSMAGMQYDNYGTREFIELMNRNWYLENLVETIV